MESVDEKAERYLLAGRLRINHKRGGRVVATCVGGEGVTYLLGWRHGNWWCHCPARVPRCSHIAALQRVCDPPGTHPEPDEVA